jgi:hypothetical protein
MKAVITKSQYNRIKNFINETKEIKKEEVLDEKKKLSKKQLRTFDVDNDGDIEADDLSDLRNMKKITKEELKGNQKKLDKNNNNKIDSDDFKLLRKKKSMDEGSDCGCGEDKDDTRYMFFSNLEQMMRQAKMLLDMDEDMLEDLLNNGHDWAADHIAEAKNNMDQVFDFIMGEMHGEGEDDSWDNDDMMYEEDDTLGTPEYAKNPVKLGLQPPKGGSTSDFVKYLQDKEKAMNFKRDKLFTTQPSTDTLGSKRDVRLEGMSLKKKIKVSKELKNHLDNKISLSESEFRSGSPKHIELLKEVKELYNKGLIALNETDEFIVNEFDPKPIKVKGIGEVYLGLILEEYESDEQLLSEAVYKGRKVSLGKPFLTPDGPKKRSVYVRNDKGNVVKVNFGDPNMRIKKNNPARRKSFRARHKCSQQKDRTSSAYWSCRFW